jgi:hypothetical protein
LAVGGGERVPKQNAIVVGVGDRQPSVQPEGDIAGPIQPVEASSGIIGGEVLLPEHEMRRFVGARNCIPNQHPVVPTIRDEKALTICRQASRVIQCGAASGLVEAEGAEDKIGRLPRHKIS